jgi:sulfatase modifying factor 1
VVAFRGVAALRARVASIASLGALGVACNGLLGNADHDVAADASIGILASGDASLGATTWGNVDAGSPCAPGCATGATQCEGSAVQTCVPAANGCPAWGVAVPCASGTCSAGQCAGACVPGDAQCSGNGAQTCSGGQWSAPTSCVKQTCVAGACTGVCAPGATNAIACGNCGSNTQTCSSNGTWQDGTCADQGKCTGSTPYCVNGACNADPPSCAPHRPGMTNCGAGGSASCCASPGVTGGSYFRSYDGLTYTDNSHPATLSTFRLDQYEVTVGRFRQFVGAVLGGWVPTPGSGKHTHLNGGQGLSATGGGYEPGWDASWTSDLPTTASGWDADLGGGTWTPAAGSNENLPISNVGWDEAYAFCIWDGAFLPSEAEWNYAAAGGSDQRMFPWSAAFPPGSSDIGCTEAFYSTCSSSALPSAVGSVSPAGDGKWGQADLAGNVEEYSLDWSANYTNPCSNCTDVTVTGAGGRSLRGGGFLLYSPGGTSLLTASARLSTGTFATGTGVPRTSTNGVRCARAP